MTLFFDKLPLVIEKRVSGYANKNRTKINWWFRVENFSVAMFLSMPLELLVLFKRNVTLFTVSAGVWL